MRVLRVHAGDTPPGLAQAISEAVRAFNASLDIRLRFLAIGVEETVVDVADAAGAAEAVGAALDGARPDVVLLIGDGEAAVAAATVAASRGATLVRVGAGRREGATADAARAVDRMAHFLLVHDEAGLGALAEEGHNAPRLEIGPAGDPGTGDRVVRALARARRGAGGDSKR